MSLSQVNNAVWRNKRLRFIAIINPKSKNSMNDEMLVSFVPMEKISELGGLNLDLEKNVGEVKKGYTYFENGDIVIAKITPCFENGKGSLCNKLLNGVGYGTTELMVVRASQVIDKEFLFYITISHHFRKAGEAEMLGAGGQKRVPEEFLKNLIISFPSTLGEQQTITKFLDYKTAQIDSLIEKKEELLKLLEEKRIALITNAVTGKLTCNSEEPVMSSEVETQRGFKPSGIPWLGEIPSNWEVKRLKYVAQVRFSGVDKKTIEGENDVLLCNYVDVYKNDFIDNKIEFMKATATNNEIDRFTIKKDDVIATKDSESPYEIALPALVNQEFENVVCGYHLALIRADNKEITGEFLFRLFQASSFNSQFIVQANGITRFGLGVDAFTNAMVPIPSIEEQKSIVCFITIELNKIDKLSKKVTEAIEKLKEYRTSLITSAVTGKIDLRNWQHPTEACTERSRSGEVEGVN